MIRRLKAAVFWGMAAASALVVGWITGRLRGKQDAKIEELKGYGDTRVRMDEVDRISDADAARQWLRDRDK